MCEDQPLVRQGISWKAHSDSLRTLKAWAKAIRIVYLFVIIIIMSLKRNT